MPGGRIGTPRTTERASLEKDRRTDTRTVMNAIALNIKNSTADHVYLYTVGIRYAGKTGKLQSVDRSVYDVLLHFLAELDKIGAVARYTYKQ